MVTNVFVLIGVSQQQYILTVINSDKVINKVVKKYRSFLFKWIVFVEIVFVGTVFVGIAFGTSITSSHITTELLIILYISQAYVAGFKT